MFSVHQPELAAWDCAQPDAAPRGGEIDIDRSHWLRSVGERVTEDELAPG